MPTPKSKYRLWLKKIRPIIYALGLILSLVGSYQVYHGQFSNIWKELTVILYSVMKLFTFSPTLGFEKEAPLAYELAIWLAPLTTVLSFFSFFKQLYLRLRRRFKKLSSRPVIVNGWNEEAKFYVQNCLKADNKASIVLLVDSEEIIGLGDLEAECLTLGLHLMVVNYQATDELLLIEQFKDYQLEHYHTLVSFEQTAKSYTCLSFLSPLYQAANSQADVFLKIDHQRVKDLIDNHLFYLENFTINYFNIDELIAAQLFHQSDFPFYMTPGLKKPWSDVKNLNLDTFKQKVGRPHLLVVGYDEHFRALVRMAVNIGTVAPMQPLRLTLVDEKASQYREQLLDDIEGLSSALDIVAIDSVANSLTLRAQLEEIDSSLPFTGFIISLAEETQRILTMDRLQTLFEDRPLALKVKHGKQITYQALKNKFPKLVLFGQLEQVLTDDLLLNQTYLEAAKRFNASYNESLAILMGQALPTDSVAEQWQKLSPLNQASSYYQALHKPIKLLILTKLTEIEKTPLTPLALLEEWETRLKGLSIPNQVAVIVQDDLMNIMAAVEHERWNHFYFIRHFVYGEKKDLSRRYHDCLITDWKLFTSSSKRDTIIYDFLSTLDLKEGLKADSPLT